VVPGAPGIPVALPVVPAVPGSWAGAIGWRVVVLRDADTRTEPERIGALLGPTRDLLRVG
jgi:hypothetical protein